MSRYWANRSPFLVISTVSVAQESVTRMILNVVRFGGKRFWQERLDTIAVIVRYLDAGETRVVWNHASSVLAGQAARA